MSDIIERNLFKLYGGINMMEIILTLAVILAVSGIVAIMSVEDTIEKAKEQNRDPQYWWEN